MMTHGRFKSAIEQARYDLIHNGHVVHPQKWQSVDVSDKPEMATHEILNHSFKVPVYTEDLEVLKKDIGPNLPWADDHFLERVGGFPINPGVQWANWPYAHSANKFRDEKGEFSHTYMERIWTKPLYGIRFDYGNLSDVVKLLSQQPLTRQAFLPIWFPEDTGVTEYQRVPCTLGYHFIQRFDHLHVVYYIRSCDYVRHFRDDIYLTVRLLLWVIEELRGRGQSMLTPGIFTMHITSLHAFRNDVERWWR